MALVPDFFGALLSGTRGMSLVLEKDSVVVSKAGNRLTNIPLMTIERVDVLVGAFWATLQIKSDQETVAFRGVAKEKAEVFAEVLLARVGEAFLAAHREHQPPIRRLAARIDAFLAQPKYLANRDLQQLKAATTDLERFSLNLCCKLIRRQLFKRDDLPDDLLREIEMLAELFEADTVRLRLRNDRFVNEEIAKNVALFDTIEATPLTHEQRVAAVVMEDRNLLVASAGSGKTSTIVGKIGYALRTQQYASEEILLLAFNADAARELDERANSKLSVLLSGGKRIKAKTFHSLGLEVIAATRGKKPSISAHANGGALLEARLIDQLITEQMWKDPSFVVDWLLYRAICFKPTTDPTGFKTVEEWNKYLREQGQYRNGKPGFLTMLGELVKSQGELAIANWLYLQGIDYEYEREYEHPTATVDHRQYHPDFYFPDIGTYLEHYALDKDGKPPAAFGKKYAESMAWKQRLHADNATDLIVTTFADFVSGNLFPKLEQELRDRGQQFAPRSSDEVLRHLGELQMGDSNSFIRTFIKHAKSNEVDPAVLRAAAANHAQPFRAHVFVRVITKIMAAYQRKLDQAGEIDFEDMIVKATEAVSAGRFPHSYKLILVDEFQDISQGRAKLVNALLKQAPDCKLFAVGDDWQSIYRFAGSDIEVFTEFSQHFGATAVNFLTQTFRSNKGITDVAARFIQKNPNQVSKRVVSTDDTEEGVVVVRHHASRREQSERCKDALLEIAESGKRQGSKSTVFILGRYRHQRPKVLEQWQGQFNALDVSFRTIHSSKGLQADHVIIVGLSSGRYSFPSEIADDPLIQLVMPRPELFYVAMTRARHSVHIIGSSNLPSAFLTEIMEAEAGGRALRIEPTEQGPLILGGLGPHKMCPRCGTGRLRERPGRFGQFWGCSEYPRCNYTRSHRVDA